MNNKEQIMIDGKKYNKCEGCELYDGYMCNGARSYETEGEAHRAICDKHIAQEFWKVYNQLALKSQKYEALTKTNRIHADIIGELNNKYNDLKQECAQKDERIIELTKEALSLKQKCEELKDKLAVNQFNLEQKCKVLKDVGVVQDKNGGYQVMEIDRYRKALEEIEKLINDDEFIKCPIHDDENCNYGTSRKILNIINKAKSDEAE